METNIDRPSRLEQCYVLSPNEGAPQRSFCTQGEVRQAARLIPKDARQYARIMLVGYPVSKRYNVARRNGVPDADQVLRKWRLTSRAALVEIPVDQD